MQPNLFLKDTEGFLDDINGQIEVLNEKQGRRSPTLKKLKTEQDY
jgi:hypothetical protein